MIKINREGDLYSACVDRGSGPSASHWESPTATTAENLRRQLKELGFDYRDIDDAFYACNPIEIARKGDRYVAEVWPWNPLNRGEHWKSPSPMPPRELFLLLKGRGLLTYHIMDAFWKCDGTDEAMINLGEPTKESLREGR